MKKLLALTLPIILMFSSTACAKSDDNSSSGGSQSAQQSDDKQNASGGESTAGFKVDGTKLIDANGNEFIMRGINHAHSWFRDQDGIALSAIAATNANTVRLVLSDGEQWQKDTAEEITALIDSCKEKEMVAIVEVHDATGYDDVDSLNKAVDFWIEMKDTLIGNEDTVILNIANEWVGQWDSHTWRDGYTAAIPKLRDAGIKNTIMVDSAGWGQYGKCIEDYGEEVFRSDPQANTMFSVHMYGSAGGSQSSIESNLRGATDQGLCVCVGEFGYNHSDGDVDEDYIMSYCQDNGIGYLGWSWKGNGGGVEYLDITSDWEGTQLSPDWGEKLINGENGIKATSKKCTVFE